MQTFNNFLFIAFPYVAIAVFLIGSIWRYKQTGFRVSSLSSQFLEGGALFWGSIPFHFGVLFLFFGHLIAFLFPQSVLAWNSQPLRLLILEGTGLVFAFCMFFGLVGLMLRRLTNPKVRVVTSKMDILLEWVLLIQVVLGVWIALGYRWGSSWFASDLSPYLWSIMKLSPDIEVVNTMPVVIQLHIIGAFLIIFLIPFTRLVHFLVAPLHYINRPYQQVIWYWDRKKIRSADTPWGEARPKNNLRTRSF